MLKFLATAPPSADYKGLAALPNLEEILLEHQLLARTGLLDDAALINGLQQNAALGVRSLLSWDVLADDPSLQAGAALLRQLPLDLIGAVRAHDVGVAYYLRQQFPQLPLHLILETGNHNLPGIQAWVRELTPERVILSNELPIDLITQVVATIDTQVEIAVLGRLLIFYSPRPLVQAAEGGAMDEVRQRYAIEEQKGKQFPILENRHGTFMYYEKDLNILPWLDEVAAAGVAFARLDFKFFDDALLETVGRFLTTGDVTTLDEVKNSMSFRQTRGFFKSNRTDKQFDKLSNPSLRVSEDQPLLATVLESAKKEGYMALLTEGPMAEGDMLHLIIPEGDTLSHQISFIRSADGTRVKQANEPGLWLINHARRTSSGTRIYKA